MEITNRTNKEAQRLMNLPKSYSTQQEISRKGYLEVSRFKGELTQKGIVDNVTLLKKSFPDLPTEFYEVLVSRIKEHGFSDERFRQAINHVADTCVYPRPTIANFINFNPTYKLHTHKEIVRMLNEDSGAFSNYKSVRVPNYEKPMYIHESDFDLSGLPPFKDAVQQMEEKIETADQAKRKYLKFLNDECKPKVIYDKEHPEEENTFKTLGNSFGKTFYQVLKQNNLIALIDKAKDDYNMNKKGMEIFKRMCFENYDFETLK